MKEKEKKLLLQDLCGRIPYGVIVQWTKPKCGIEHIDKWDNKQVDYKVRGIDGLFVITDSSYVTQTYKDGRVSHHIEKFICECKPYLRSISSMTGEEQGVYNSLRYAEWCAGHWDYHETKASIDWLLENHFDFRGLIDKGLAIEVTPENNPYKL